MHAKIVNTAGLYGCQICGRQIKPGRVVIKHNSFTAHKLCIQRALDKCPPDEDEIEVEIQQIQEFIQSGGEY